MKISVVIPLYYSNNTIERCLESVYMQTLPVNEVILVDDTGDKSHNLFINNLIKKYKNIFTICLNKNYGVATARNIGIGKSTGTHIAFIDSDDTWLIDKIKIQSEFIKEYDFDVCGHLHTINTDNCHPKLFINKLNKLNKINKKNNIKELYLYHFLIKNRFITSSVMIKNNKKIRFRDGQRYMEDHNLWLNCAANGYKIGIVNEVLACQHKYSYGQGGLSKSLYKMQSQEINNFYNLYINKHISFYKFIGVILLSYIKFIRRLIVIFLRF